MRESCSHGSVRGDRGNPVPYREFSNLPHADTHEIVAVELTPDDVGDITEVSDLLNQIDVDVASMTADGAYDGEVVYDVVAERHPGAAIIIPPRITSVTNETTARQRDEHFAMIAKHGRMSGGETGLPLSARQSGPPRAAHRCLLADAQVRDAIPKPQPHRRVHHLADARG